MARLFGGVRLESGPLAGGGGSRDVGAHAGNRFGRVAVLARIVSQLVASQLSGRPALVEGMLEDVPLTSCLLDAVPQILIHDDS